jgi:hypothetical protein
MLDSESVANVLHALATGHTDRALNVVATSAELKEDARSVLLAALSDDGGPSAQARRFGDGLRSLGAPRHLVNECYRVSFYAGDEWKRLSGNPLFGFFAANRAGSPIDKWVHYFPILERHLKRYRGTPSRALEIGVYRGGGLELLRHYLGAEAYLVGIDIDTQAAQAVAGRYPVEIGDQEDPEFLRLVAERHGPFDVVIDDGGHRMRQQIVSVQTLFPLLQDGGTYLVEDCHTSYWDEYAGPESDGPTFIGWLKERIDDLHAYHYSSAQQLDPPWQTSLAGLHLYDSVAVLDKESRWPPFSELAGTKEFINRQVAALQVEVLATRDAALARETEAREELRIARGELAEAAERVRGAQAEADSASGELAHVRDDLIGSWGIIQEMRRSRSWRVTAPLRWVKSILKR